MKFLAIIPARGGSKGIPNKNIIEVNGKPLIYWTIKQAIDSGVVDYIHVSTDSPEIAKVAKNYGANCDFLRNSKFANDEIGTLPAVISSIFEIEKSGLYFDYVMELQPTYYLRGSKLITEIVQKLKSEPDLESLFSCIRIRDTAHPDYCYTLDEKKKFKSRYKPDKFNRHMLKDALACKGIVLCSQVEILKKYNTFFSPNAVPFIVEDKLRAQDIDDEHDLLVANCLMKNKLQLK